MEENQPKTMTDREVWKKAENINKAKFLVLLGQSPKTAWILAIIGLVLVAALAILVPSPDPRIKSASQHESRIAVLFDGVIHLADKTKGIIGSIKVDGDTLAVACGKDHVIAAQRSRNRVLVFDWNGKLVLETMIDSPSAVGVGSSWIYISTGDRIGVFEDGKQVNKMKAPEAKVTKSIIEREAIWLMDYMAIWKSGPMGWIPIPLEGDNDYKSAWVGDNISILLEDGILTLTLEGKPLSKTGLPDWASQNSWLCSDLISINDGQMIIGSPTEANPARFDLPK